MSETKFTSGPWKTEQILMDVEISAEPPHGHLSVCWVHIGQGAEIDEVKAGLADAALIAAAPEMYESLKDAEKQIVQMYRGINPAANEGEGNRMADNDWSVKSIRAALAKAVKQ